MKKALLMMASIAFLQTACSTTPKANPHFKVGEPYTVEGKTYFPAVNPKYSEIGTASWYGGNFNNKLTANGEIFNGQLMTAAHRTLPLPSIAKVTNLENGRSIYVRVNDRGPFSKNRIIDLSQKAAATLGFMNKGETKVLVEVDRQASATALNSVKISEDEKKYVLSLLQIGTGEATASNLQVSSKDPVGQKTQSITADQNSSQSQTEIAKQKMLNETKAKGKLANLDGGFIPASLSIKKAIEEKKSSSENLENTENKISETLAKKVINSESSGFYVQIASKDSEEQANMVANKFSSKYAHRVESAVVNGKQFYRVQLGEFTDGKSAKQAKEIVKNLGYKDAFIIKAN